MVEFVVRVAMHPDPFHHRPGASIGLDGERPDLGEADHAEPVVEGGPGRLGGMTLSPCAPSRAPADLDCRGEMGVEPGRAQTDESGKREFAGDLHRPQSPSMFLDKPTDAIPQPVRLGSGQRWSGERHHPGVGVEGGEWRADR